MVIEGNIVTWAVYAKVLTEEIGELKREVASLRGRVRKLEEDTDDAKALDERKDEPSMPFCEVIVDIDRLEGNGKYVIKTYGGGGGGGRGTGTLLGGGTTKP